LKRRNISKYDDGMHCACVCLCGCVVCRKLNTCKEKSRMKTHECGAPMRVQASMATTASGTIGM
jgi:hypothetical protein